MAQKVHAYVDRIVDECDAYRSDACKAVKEMGEIVSGSVGGKRNSMSTAHEGYEGEQVRKGLTDKFNRIHLYSEEERKIVGNCSKKLALTAFTNDTMQSEVQCGEAEDFKLLNTQITKLEDIINKMSSGTDEELNAVILRGLENINSKLDAVVTPNVHIGEQQTAESGKPVR